MSNLAVIQATETSPEIRYPKPDNIEIVDYDEMLQRIDDDIKRHFPDGFDGTITPEMLESITRDDVKVAKHMRAGIRAKATAIDDRRKEVKRAWTEPLKVFELKANRMRDRYKEVDAELKKYIDTAEDYFKAQKRAELKEYWEGASVLSEAIPFERIEKPEWLKLSESPKKAEAEILEIIQRIAGDIEVIESTCGDWVQECKEKYIATLDLSQAMAEKKNREEIAERTRRMDEERAAIAAQQEAAQPPELAAEPFVPPAPVVVPPISESLAEPSGMHEVLVLTFDGPVADMELFKAEFRELVRKYPKITCKRGS